MQLYSADQPEIAEVVAEMRQVVDTYPDRVLIGPPSAFPSRQMYQSRFRYTQQLDEQFWRQRVGLGRRNATIYYYHAFLKEQPDLNWRNPEVRAALYAVMRFWLDRGVDGFRIDVLWHLIKDATFQDNPINPAYTDGQPDIMTVSCAERTGH